MSWLKRVFAKNVDERQEMDLLKVEHCSFWLMYYLLVIEIVVQGIILDGGDKILGEWIVFMVVSIFALVGWIRKGVWSFQSKKVPGVKSYLRYSLITGVVAGIIGFLGGLKGSAGNIPMLMEKIIGTAAGGFLVAFILFLIMGSITRKREKKLEEQAAEEEDE